MSEDVDEIKMAGKKQNMAPMWKKLMRNADLYEPTSFLDHVSLVLKVNANRTKLLLTNTKNCLNLVFLLEQLKNTRMEKPHAKMVACTTWKDMLKNALRDIANWQTKRQQQFFRASSP